MYLHWATPFNKGARWFFSVCPRGNNLLEYLQSVPTYKV